MQESYIAYLKELLQRHEEDTATRINQLHAHYNRQRRRDKRESNVWMVLSILLILAFLALFLYDFSHKDRGWIVEADGVRYYTQSAMVAVRNFISRWW